MVAGLLVPAEALSGLFVYRCAFFLSTAGHPEKEAHKVASQTLEDVYFSITRLINKDDPEPTW